MLGFIRKNREVLALLYIVLAVAGIAALGYLFGDRLGIEESGLATGWLVGVLFAVATLGVIYLFGLAMGVLGDRVSAFRAPSQFPAATVKKYAEGEHPQRLEARVPVAGGSVEIYGEPYPLKDWSPSGFLVTSCDLDRQPGDEVTIHLSVPVGNKMIDIDCHGLVVRVEHERQELAGMFVMMGKEAHEEIAGHFRRQIEEAASAA